MASFKDTLRGLLRGLTYMYDDIDTVSAQDRIKSGIYFKGPTVWILAFSIIVASVGLNVNSTAVIIGAMLISPLMGPIIGFGLALGTNDLDLLKAALRNLMIMVAISLLASTLFFILSPLSLVNPTELEARTSPTIYDVLIAFFGGLAGILENSRKERGTVLSGVAIATALMPPLCTAGYGLAHLDMHFFFGALYLFIINSVFISLATYLMVKYLRFKTVSGIDEATAKKRRTLITWTLVIVLIPSIWSAFNLIGDNNFERNVRLFVENNRFVGEHTYVYDFSVKGRHASLSLAGDPIEDSVKKDYLALAAKYHIKEKDLTLNVHSIGLSQKDMNAIIEDIYTKADTEISQYDALLSSMQIKLDLMQAQIEELKAAQEPIPEDVSDSVDVEFVYPDLEETPQIL